MLPQALTIVSVVVVTYVFLQLLGPRPKNLFIPLTERQRWTSLLDSRLGSLLYICNITATLTSLATVFIFFIGSSPLFGHYIYISSLTVVLGAYVTVHLTSKLANSPKFIDRLHRSEVSTVAIASLFWDSSVEGRRASATARLITLVSIACIIWLEFATFASLAGSIFGLTNPTNKALLMFFAVLFIFDFTLRNGLRGFIFTDLLHAPMILIGTIGVLVGSFQLAGEQSNNATQLLTAAPKLPIAETLVFVVATIFLNSFILLTGESHWIRVWAMRSQVKRATVSAGIAMAVTWLLLIAAGLLIAGNFPDGGIQTVTQLIAKLGEISPIFFVAFWMAASAALFSTADTQVYSFLLVGAFDSSSGEVRTNSAIAKSPFLAAIAIAIVFSITYFGVQYFSLPFEQIVFFTFPLFLCLVPGLIQILKNDKITPTPMALALILYLLCGLGMIIFPSHSFFFSLGAPLMPAAVSIGMFLRR